jgi:hypothetical protein
MEMNMNAVAKILPYVNCDQPSQEELDRDFRASARTSITRRKPSAPLQILIAEGLIHGSVLNYGKGRCSTDSDAICNSVGHCVDYDYTWYRTDVIHRSVGAFHSVYCGYVVNTLPPQSRNVVWNELSKVVRAEGSVFVAARSINDRGIKGTPHEDGVITSIGTFQIGYEKQQLIDEALNYFPFVKALKHKSGFYLVQCSHSPIR